MNVGIDSEKILKKIWVEIEDEWSLFRTYCEILTFASKELIAVIEDSINNLNSVYFINDTIGFACGFNGKIYRTITGGFQVGKK